MNEFVNNMAIAVYLEAAKRINDELDARGFTTEAPDGAQGLVEKIAEIILQTVQGNTNYSESEPDSEEMTQEDWDHWNGFVDAFKEPDSQEPDGWEGDLQNQGPDYDEYPPTHPLEN